MQIKEVLEQLSDLHKYCFLTQSTSARMGFKFTERFFIKVKNTLEKQIPMQAVIHGERNRKINSISYTCPVCKSHINRSNYCSSCGQAIVFETENENDVI